MNFFKLISALTAAGAIVACDSSTSSGNGAPNGDLRYSSVPFNQGNMSASCNVYSTSNSVTMVAEANGFNSSQKTVTKGTWNSDGSFTETSDTQMSGLFLMNASDMCDEMKKCYGAAYVTCTEDRVTSDITTPQSLVLKPANDSTIKETVDRLSVFCDEFRENAQEQFIVFSATPSDPSAEKATSCDVNVSGNIITQQIVFPTRTATVIYTYGAEKIFITESYTGVDDVTLQAVCEHTKSDPDSYDVVCNGATITSYNLTEGAPMESVVEYVKDGLCTGFLSGNLTLEKMWFED